MDLYSALSNYFSLLHWPYVYVYASIAKPLSVIELNYNIIAQLYIVITFRLLQVLTFSFGELQCGQ